MQQVHRVGVGLTNRLASADDRLKVVAHAAHQVSPDRIMPDQPCYRLAEILIRPGRYVYNQAYACAFCAFQGHGKFLKIRQIRDAERKITLSQGVIILRIGPGQAGRGSQNNGYPTRAGG